MAKVHILLYRQWDIYFSTEKERFLVEHNVNDLAKEKLSFAAAMTFIDQFIKDNAVFEPFLVEKIKSWGGGPKERAKVIGIRKDGRFVLENSKGEKQQVSEWDEKDWSLVDDSNGPIEAEIEQLNAQIEGLANPINKLIKAAQGRLKHFTLAQQKLRERYEEWVDPKERNRFNQD